MASSGGEPTPAGERLTWDYNDVARVLIVGRSFEAIRRAATALDLPLRRWNAIVSPEAPEDWPAVFTRVDVILAPSTGAAVERAGADG